MTTNNELLPCPFCGCEGYPTYKTNDRGLQNHVVFCTSKSCGAKMVGEFSEERIIAAWNRRPPAMPADAAPILSAKHTGMMVDYSGLIMQAANALVTGAREPALAGMIRQLQEHLTELGLRWYEGDTTVVDTFLQLYCIASESRRTIEGERK